MLGSPAVREGQSMGEISSARSTIFVTFHSVIPAQAGIQGGSAESLVLVALDSRLRGNDVVGGMDRGRGSTARIEGVSPPSLASLTRDASKLRYPPRDGGGWGSAASPTAPGIPVRHGRAQTRPPSCIPIVLHVRLGPRVKPGDDGGEGVGVALDSRLRGNDVVGGMGGGRGPTARGGRVPRPRAGEGREQCAS
jgi:hypothetical protein